MFAAAVVGAVLGFLWWNAAPAKIIMGDTGSQALGGALAALALLTNTHLLLILLGGLYVMVTVSVILQVFSFRVFGKRIFRMAPIHHHFELKGWPETTVIIRFWILAGVMVAIGVGLFYADFLVVTEGGYDAHPRSRRRSVWPAAMRPCQATRPRSHGLRPATLRRSTSRRDTVGGVGPGVLADKDLVVTSPGIPESLRPWWIAAAPESTS